MGITRIELQSEIIDIWITLFVTLKVTWLSSILLDGLLTCRTWSEVEKIIWKNQNRFQKTRSTNFLDSDYWMNYRRSTLKNLESTILFVDINSAVDYIPRGKMEQILLEYGFFKETVTAIMILYKNTKAIVRSANGNTDVFARVLQGETLPLIPPIIFLDFVLRSSNERKWSQVLKKAYEQMISRRNNFRRRLRRWFRASRKYTCASQIPAA